MSAVPARSEALAHLSPAAVLLLLTALIALQPLATDLYVPSLPGIARDFGAPVAAVQWTLSMFVVGFAVGQLVVGPLSDRYGRMPVLLGGAGLYCLASIACALAPDIGWLIAARFFQAVGACSGLVAVRAMVRDLFTPQEGARTLATAGMLMSIAPLGGPVLGGYLEMRFGWRAAFVVLAAISAVVLVACAMKLAETSPFRNPQATRLAPMLRAYVAVLGNPTFRAYAFAAAASYGGLFAFISGSSFVFIRVLGIPPQRFGVLYALAILGYLVGAFLCRRVLPRLGVSRTLQLGAVFALAGGLSMVALALAGVRHAAAILVPQFLYLVAHGLVQPCGQAGSVAPFPDRAGTASALMGAIMMVVASLVGAWMGLSFDGTARPLVFTVGAASLVVAGVAFGLVRRHGRV